MSEWTLFGGVALIFNDPSKTDRLKPEFETVRPVIEECLLASACELTVFKFREPLWWSCTGLSGHDRTEAESLFFEHQKSFWACERRLADSARESEVVREIWIGFGLTTDREKVGVVAGWGTGELPLCCWAVDVVSSCWGLTLAHSSRKSELQNWIWLD